MDGRRAGEVADLRIGSAIRIREDLDHVRRLPQRCSSNACRVEHLRIRRIGQQTGILEYGANLMLRVLGEPAELLLQFFRVPASISNLRL